MPPFPAWVYALYYRWAGLCNRLLPWIRLDGMRLRVAPGVYKPIQNEARVAAWVPPGGRALDVGCGCGVLGLAAARRSASVLALDVDPEAVACTRENAQRLGLTHVEAREADVFRAAPEGPFDVVLCGPPFAEADVGGGHPRWASAAGFLPKLFEHAPSWLAPGGLLIVHHMTSARPRLEALANANGLALRAAHPNHEKSLGLHALAWLYLQPGLRTAIYLFDPKE